MTTDPGTRCPKCGGECSLDISIEIERIGAASIVVRNGRVDFDEENVESDEHDDDVRSMSTTGTARCDECSWVGKIEELVPDATADDFPDGTGPEHLEELIAIVAGAGGQLTPFEASWKIGLATDRHVRLLWPFSPTEEEIELLARKGNILVGDYLVAPSAVVA